MSSPETIIETALKEKRLALFEHEAKELVRSAGVTVPRFEVVGPDDERTLVTAAETLGFPVALKAESPDILHKTDAGAVVLDIKNRNELVSAAKQMTTALSRLEPAPALRHFLIEKMMPAGPEVLIGALRDEQFGPSIAFGLGGIWTEAFRDAAFGILPLSQSDMNALIDTTRASHFFRGFRGTPPLDREAVFLIINALSGIMTKHEAIREVDLNPVRVYARGAAALDVRIVIKA